MPNRGNIRTELLTVFTDREGAIARFRESLETAILDPGYLKIFFFVGHGGVGKSRLAGKLIAEANAKADRGAYPVHVSLEHERHVGAALPLSIIRNQLRFDCFLFDTALIRYEAIAGKITTRSDNGSLLFQAAETLASAYGWILPISFGTEIYRNVKASLAHLFGYRKAEFEEIDSLRNDKDALYERLPTFLGSDIGRHCTKRGKERPIFFLDSYERQNAETRAEQSSWLQRLILQSGAGLFAIFSRELPSWDENRWLGKLSVVPVEAFSQHDSENYLQQVGIQDETIRGWIHTSAKGIPLLLALNAEIYFERRSQDLEVTNSDFEHSSKGVIEKFILHLPEDIQHVVRALAVVKIFDQEVVDAMVDALNARLRSGLFEAITRLFIVEPIFGSSSLFKIHDTVSRLLRTVEIEKDHRLVRTLTDAYSKIVYRKVTEELFGTTAIQVLGNLLELLADLPSPLTRSNERAIRSGLRIYDQGFWIELQRTTSNLLGGSANTASGARDIATFLNSLSRRRLQSVDEALNVLETVREDPDIFGDELLSLKLERIYLVELLGDYTSARQEIAELYLARSERLDHSKRADVRLSQCYSDFLIMDGEFPRGLEISSALANELEQENTIGWCETMRLVGHCYRFNYLMEDAELTYLRALARCDPRAEGLQGKILSNLGETLCLSNPAMGLRYSQQALDQNEKARNLIEIGKNLCSLSISQTALNSYEEARSNWLLARRRFEEVAYPSGRVFCQIAEILWSFRMRGLEDTQRLVLELRREALNLGAYQHLGMLGGFLISDKSVVSELLRSISWLDKQQLKTRLSRVLAKFRD